MGADLAGSVNPGKKMGRDGNRMFLVRDIKEPKDSVLTMFLLQSLE